MLFFTELMGDGLPIWPLIVDMSMCTIGRLRALLLGTVVL